MIDYKIDQWFVRVEPDNTYRKVSVDEVYINEKEKKCCKSIIEAIERHVDDFSYMLLDNDGHYECSFCGWYSADEKDYECCEDSIAEYENLKAKARELTESEEQNAKSK